MRPSDTKQILREETASEPGNLANSIIVRDGEILIDEEPLPWPVTQVSVDFSVDDMPKLIIAIPAESIAADIFPFYSPDKTKGGDTSTVGDRRGEGGGLSGSSSPSSRGGGDTVA